MPAKQSFTSKVYEWFEDSLITQSIVTIIVVGTVCALYLAPLFGVVGVEVPGELLTIAGLILGYWFKTKDQKAARAMMSRPQ